MRRRRKEQSEEVIKDEKSLSELTKQRANIKTGLWLTSSGTRAFSDSILSPFIPLYGKHIEATSTEIGFIVSITSLLSIVQLFWAYLAQKFNISRILAIITSYIPSVFIFILVKPIKGIFTFAAMRGMHSITISATLPTSANLFVERTSPRSWPLRNSLLQGVLVFGTLIGTIIGGIILWKIPIENGFLFIFIFSGILGIISAIFLQAAIPSRKRLEARGRWYQIEEVDFTLSNTLATMKTDRNFLIFCLINLLFVFGVNLSGPFYIIFNTSYYDLSVIQTALLTTIGLIPQTISSIITAKLIEKVRKKELLVVAGIMTSFFPIFFMIPSLAGRTTNVFWILIILWSVNGISWGIINSSLATLLLDIIHPRRRTLQLAINNSISSIALFIAPIIGGAIIENTKTIYIVLSISASFRFLGAVLFSLVKEPIIGGTILRPIQRVIPYIIRSNAEKGVTILASGKSSKKTKIRMKR